MRASEIERLVRFGAEVKDAANAVVTVVHPDIPEIGGIYGTIVDGRPRRPAARPRQTGARRHAGESIIGSMFTGRVLGTAEVGGLPAVVPEIGGTAHLLGHAIWLIDARDELGGGFLVR